MIPYRIEFAKPAIKQLAKLPKNIRQRVSDFIGRIMELAEHRSDIFRRPQPALPGLTLLAPFGLRGQKSGRLNKDVAKAVPPLYNTQYCRSGGTW